MVHPVEINDDDLKAKASRMREAAAELSKKAAPPATPPAVVEGETVNDLGADYSALETWKSAVSMALTVFHGQVMPEWEVSGKGREIIVEGIAEQFAEWWPDGVYDLEKLPPWAKCMAGLALIVFANLDMEKMELRPMKPVPVEEESEDIVAEDAAAKAPGQGKLLSEEDRA